MMEGRLPGGCEDIVASGRETFTSQRFPLRSGEEIWYRQNKTLIYALTTCITSPFQIIKTLSFLIDLKLQMNIRVF